MSDDSSRLTDDHEEAGEAEDGEKPLACVRYGLGKEILLYPDAVVVAYLEEHT